MQPDSLDGREFFLALTGTTPEFRAWEGLTAVPEFTADRSTVRFPTTHSAVPAEHRGGGTLGPPGDGNLTWTAEETRGFPVQWTFAFGFVDATVGTFIGGPEHGSGQASGIAASGA